jgi:integrase
MIFDKNLERIKELERKLAAGGDSAKLKARIQSYRDAGPEWWVKFYLRDGRARKEKCPPWYQTKLKAKQFECLKRAEVQTGNNVPSEVNQVKLSDVLEAYLSEKMAGKSGAASAKTMVGHICRHIGKLTLQQIDRNPRILVEHFRKFPETQWSQKYIYNYFLTLRASINHWIRFNRLRMQNPCNLVEISPGVRVMDYVPTPEDYQRILAASYVVGAPDDIRNLFTAVWETGLRINEVLSWQCEDLHLEQPDIGLPYYDTKISKQGRAMRKQIPMTKELWIAMRAQIGIRENGQVWPWTSAPYDITRAVLKEAGLSHMRPFHDFRKSAKVRFMAFGREAAKAMQGHATDSMNDYYLHFQRQDLESVVRGTWGDHQSPNSPQK